MPIADDIVAALKANNAVLISTDTCLSCCQVNDIGRFLLLKLEWQVKGKKYPTIGLFLCKSCSSIEVDYKRLLSNLRYQLLEFNSKVIE